MTFTTKLALPLQRGGFCAEVEDPARNEATKNGDIRNDDGDIVFDVIDAKVDWVRPIRLEQRVQSVAV